MEQQHIENGLDYPVLGPAYFSAQDAAERFMQAFEAEQFKPLLEKFTDQFADKMWDTLQTFLISDMQSNLQSHIWRDVDDIVKAILGGEQWVLNRYVLPEHFDCNAVRAAVAKLIPEEVIAGRIRDLEKEVADLRSSLEMYRNRY